MASSSLSAPSLFTFSFMYQSFTNEYVYQSFMNEYDVFVSFHGKDTSKRFTNSLFCALNMKDIRVFPNNKEMERYKRVDELAKVIERSKFFIPIFSRNYACSQWRLKEIENIVKVARQREGRRSVLPVFYKIKRTDVSNQQGTMAAFEKHEKKGHVERQKLNDWRVALNEATKHFAYDISDGHEVAAVVQTIVQRVQEGLYGIPHNAVEHHTGIKSPSVDTIETLGCKTDARMERIHGTREVGKIITAEEDVYDKSSRQFETQRTCSSHLKKDVSKSISHPGTSQTGKAPKLGGMETHASNQSGSENVNQHLKDLDLSGFMIKELPKSIASQKDLRILHLDACEKLEEVPQWVADLDHLEVLSLSNCPLIKELPPNLGPLTKLRHLNLSHCKEIKALPESVGKLTSLTELLLESTSLVELPESVGNLSKLEILHLGSCKRLVKLPSTVEKLQNLTQLLLDGSNIQELPSSVASLKKLELLSVRGCLKLKDFLIEQREGLLFLGGEIKSRK